MVLINFTICVSVTVLAAIWPTVCKWSNLEYGWICHGNPPGWYNIATTKQRTIKLVHISTWILYTGAVIWGSWSCWYFYDLFQCRTVFPTIGIPVIKIRKPLDLPIFRIGVPIPVKHNLQGSWNIVQYNKYIAYTIVMEKKSVFEFKQFATVYCKIFVAKPVHHQFQGLLMIHSKTDCFVVTNSLG